MLRHDCESVTQQQGFVIGRATIRRSDVAATAAGRMVERAGSA